MSLPPDEALYSGLQESRVRDVGDLCSKIELHARSNLTNINMSYNAKQNLAMHSPCLHAK